MSEKRVSWKQRKIDAQKKSFHGHSTQNRRVEKIRQ